jgi:hypothetical protein
MNDSCEDVGAVFVAHSQATERLQPRRQKF